VHDAFICVNLRSSILGTQNCWALLSTADSAHCIYRFQPRAAALLVVSVSSNKSQTACLPATVARGMST
jgi:hypothetical protein